MGDSRGGESACLTGVGEAWTPQLKGSERKSVGHSLYGKGASWRVQRRLALRQSPQVTKVEPECQSWSITVIHSANTGFHPSSSQLHHQSPPIPSEAKGCSGQPAQHAESPDPEKGGPHRPLSTMACSYSLNTGINDLLMKLWGIGSALI